MSRSTIASTTQSLRRIAGLLGQIDAQRQRAEKVIKQSDENDKRDAAIAGIVTLDDAQQILKGAFDAIGLYKLPFEDLHKRDDDDLIRSRTLDTCEAAYDLSGRYNQAILPMEAQAGLVLAQDTRLAIVEEILALATQMIPE